MGFFKKCACFLRRNTCCKYCKYLVWFVSGFLINILLQCHRCRWSYFVDAQHGGRQETAQSKYEEKQKHIELYLFWSCTDGENSSQWVRDGRGLHKSRKNATQKPLLSCLNSLLCWWCLISYVLHMFRVILLIAALHLSWQLCSCSSQAHVRFHKMLIVTQKQSLEDFLCKWKK